MNELDLRTKIEGLEKAIKEHNDFSNTYQSQLKETQKMLDDYYKPELTPRQLDNVQEAIEDAVGTFNFDDVDMYDIEYSLDYDGKVQAETINLNETYDLVEKIVQKVHSLFKEADCPEELDTTEPDNHPVEKLQQ
tara:strand:+ start:221 stop:625 length:405 start_codon:yes stop_codon:yes gene_type:complete